MSCPGLYKRITFVTIYSITPDDGPRPLWKSKSGREGDQKVRENARKVDRRAFADNAFDREYLLEKTFQSARQVDDART